MKDFDTRFDENLESNRNEFDEFGEDYISDDEYDVKFQDHCYNKFMWEQMDEEIDLQEDTNF